MILPDFRRNHLVVQTVNEVPGIPAMDVGLEWGANLSTTEVLAAARASGQVTAIKRKRKRGTRRFKLWCLYPVDSS